ncbi:hypothetical protein A9K79_00425 [Pseudomonas syringae pv. syringae]|nr:hypothetical protein A9K79_00425 [Pseudomonas syringae pv. syringae]
MNAAYIKCLVDGVPIKIEYKLKTPERVNTSISPAAARASDVVKTAHSQKSVGAWNKIGFGGIAHLGGSSA